jgi:Tfp pilus assembly protein PilN
MRAVNLIPAEQRGGQQIGAGRSQGAAYAVLLVVAGLALMAFLYGKADHQIASSRAQISSLTARAHQAQLAAERLAPYTSFVALREQRVQAVQTLIDSRFDWAHVFHEFGRVIPRGVSISSLDGTIGPAGSTGATSTSSGASASTSSVSSTTPPGSVPTFTISGCATSQPTVALMLQRLRLIDGAANVTLQSSTAAAASASGSSTSSGPCPPGGPAFTAQMTFDPLPSTAAEQAATAGSKTTAVSDPSSGASTSATSTQGTGLR